MKKLAVGAEEIFTEIKTEPENGRYRRKTEFCDGTAKIIDITRRKKLIVAAFMHVGENRAEFTQGLEYESALEQYKLKKKKKCLLVKICKTFLWLLFFAVWGRCLLMGALAGMVAVAVGIIVTVIISI